MPVAAFSTGRDGLFLFTVKPDNTVQEHTVQLAYQNDDIAVIAKGLKRRRKRRAHRAIAACRPVRVSR